MVHEEISTTPRIRERILAMSSRSFEATIKKAGVSPFGEDGGRRSGMLRSLAL